MKSTTGRGGEELAEIAPERTAEELLEGESLDIVPGLREIEAFELLHDAAEGLLGDFEAVGAGEEIVGPVVVLRPLEQVVVNERIARQARRCAAVEEVGGEGAMQARTFDVHLHEQDLRDRVERTSGIHLVHVAQDRMALEQEVLELPPVESAEPLPDLLDPLGVAPVRRPRDLVDLHELARHAGNEPENGGVAPIVGNEELTAGRAGVAFALVIVPDVDVDVFGLAFDDEHRRAVRGLGLRCFPDHDVGAGALHRERDALATKPGGDRWVSGSRSCRGAARRPRARQPRCRPGSRWCPSALRGGSGGGSRAFPGRPPRSRRRAASHRDRG